MNMVAWIVAGIVVGWLAHRILNDGEPSGRFGYIAAGVLGAFAGVQVLAPMFGPAPDDPNAFSMGMLVFAAVGAGVCLFIGNMVMRKFFP